MSDNQVKVTVKVQAYNLLDFAVEIQKHVLDGYRLDTESNENCPVQLGTLMVAGLVKQPEALTEVEQPEVTDTAPTRRGRTKQTA